MILRYKPVRIIFCLLLLIAAAGYIYGLVSIWICGLIILLYIALMIRGTIYIRSNYFLESQNNLQDKNCVALSFDDGPNRRTEEILDILRAHNVSASFFLIGKNVRENPELTQRIAREGHLIGNHSYNHSFFFDLQPAAKMLREINLTTETIQSVANSRILYFRPPYGVTNPMLAKAVNQSGLQSAGWSIRSKDTVAKDPELLIRKITKQIRGGDIILLHDSQEITVKVLPELIRRIRAKGMRLVRIDEQNAP